MVLNRLLVNIVLNDYVLIYTDLYILNIPYNEIR